MKRNNKSFKDKIEKQYDNQKLRNQKLNKNNRGKQVILKNRQYNKSNKGKKRRFKNQIKILLPKQKSEVFIFEENLNQERKNMIQLIKVSINPAVTAVVFIENGKFLKIQNELSGQDLKVSQEAKRFLGNLILRGSVKLEEVEKRLEISCENQNIIQLKNKTNLLGGGCCLSNKIHPVVTLKQMKNCKPCKKIERKCEQICEVAQNSVLQIIQGDILENRFLQQMNDVEQLMLKSNYSFTQPPQCYANSLSFKSLCRLHIRFQFMSEKEAENEDEEQLKSKENKMNKFCQQLKIVENVCPILDLYFFSCLIGMFYQFRKPSQKQNPPLTEQVINEPYWILSACLLIGDITSDIIQRNLGCLASSLRNLMQHGWLLIQGHQYSKMFQGMMNHWVNLGEKIVKMQEKHQPMGEEEIVLFYMKKFLEDHKNRNISVCVYILLEIDYILQVIINRNTEIKLNFQHIKFQEFICILAQDKDDRWLVQIKEFYCLMAYSTLTRYAQLSILLSLNSLVSRINQQKSLLGQVLQMSIMRRFLVEPDQNVKILIDLDESTNQFQQIVKEQGNNFWEKYIQSHQFRDLLTQQLPQIKREMKDLTDKIQEDPIHKFEQEHQIKSQQEYFEQSIQNKDQASQRYQILFNAAQNKNYCFDNSKIKHQGQQSLKRIQNGQEEEQRRNFCQRTVVEDLEMYNYYDQDKIEYQQRLQKQKSLDTNSQLMSCRTSNNKQK